MSKKEGGILFLSIIKINICQSTLEDDEVERVKNGAENLLIHTSGQVSFFLHKIPQ